MYFIDPSIVKNKNYYEAEIARMRADYKVFIKLLYGKDLWSELGHADFWDEMLSSLEEWKRSIPDMPSVNFDEEPEKSFSEIKDIDAPDFRKLFETEGVCKEILPILFPEKKVLRLLKEHFATLRRQKAIYASLEMKVGKLL
jgi:hypothetical protein